MTGFHIVCSTGHVEIVKLLMEENLKITTKKDDVHILIPFPLFFLKKIAFYLFPFFFRREEQDSTMPARMAIRRLLN